MGKNAETKFVELCRTYGVEPIKATEDQDKYEHWDYRVSGSRVEVKSRKRTNRSDSSVNDDVIFVEFLNIIGKPGWLYGSADFIAFERPEGFLFVKRTDLVALAEMLVGTQWADRPTLYKSYRRRDRPAERVGLIKISDLMSINHDLRKPLPAKNLG